MLSINYILTLGATFLLLCIYLIYINHHTMKHLKLLLAFTVLLLLQSCIWYTGGGEDDQINVGPPMQQNYEAVIMDREAFEASIQLKDPQPVTQSGKIYIKDNYLFVNDVNRGFHIYNYSDPSNPVAIAYIEAPGVTDVAMRGTTLYINQAVDLVTLVFENNTLNTVKRNRDVFPQKTAPDNSYAPIEEGQIITNWIPL